MWKGGKMYFYNPLEYKELEMVTVCNKVDIKTTKMGEAYFTHITKKIQDGDLPILLEERTLVYLNREYQESNNVIKKMNFPDFSRTVVPTPLMLFQFSACTFNSHYIHYDSIYTKEKENYPKLLVHGPLTLSLLLNMFETHANGKKPLSFEYSCIGPAFVNEKLQLHCKFQSDSCQLWATNHLDSVVLKGVLKFELL
jgi:3-methylfumaryl-CoA hydratase